MRLLFNFPHNRLTGVNTHTYTMAKKLNELGHTTDFYVDYKEWQKDILIGKLQSLGNVNVGNLPGDSKDTNLPDVDSYDVLFLNYAWTVVKMANFKKPFKIFIGHSLEEKSCQPGDITHVDKMFYISGFGAEYLSKTYNKDISYMPSWIDMDRYKPTSKIHDKLTSILILDSRNAWRYVPLMNKVCKRRGINLEVLSNMQTTSLMWNVEEEINKADLVISYGRSAYEAMACDRNVLVYGRNGGDGLMTLDTIDQSVSRNCSGYGVRSMPTPNLITENDIEKQLDFYSPYNTVCTRTIVNKLDITNLEEFLMKSVNWEPVQVEEIV